MYFYHLRQRSRDLTIGSYRKIALVIAKKIKSLPNITDFELLDELYSIMQRKGKNLLTTATIFLNYKNY